ncbi:MAG: DUF4363 family protein [Firmicutes bacterium]|nr:DUF4363 family protein [Bacillota bacterium]
MRLWIALLLIMVIIIGTGIYIENQILNVTNLISKKIDLVQEQIKEDKWQEALELCRRIEKQWSAQRELWSLFIHNHELDIVALDLARAVSLIKERDQSAALAEISVIKVQLVQLHHQEVLTLQNIF